MPTQLPAAARERLAARARHTARIRRGVVATALATFALAWGVIAHDGSMGTTTANASARSTASASGSGATASPPGDSSTSTDQPVPLTTSQS